MTNKIINTKKAFKIAIIVYAVIFVIGLAVTFIAGPKLDINFSGGAKISYSYTGDINADDFKETVKSALNKEFNLSQNTSLSGDIKTFVISLVGKDSLSAEVQDNITTALEKKFADNSVQLYDATSVSPTVATNFFLKSLVAVLITAALVVVYVGVRFRKIGGVSAALTALCALVLDLIVSFFACVIFRLPIDLNYMAVVLTILGYSLNDTIVIYDRVRENKKHNSKLLVAENVDLSITGIMKRNIITTTTTVCAVVTIVVVSEVCGLTSLRSFAIPMVFGLISGCISSLFVSGPLWVIYKQHKESKKG